MDSEMTERLERAENMETWKYLQRIGLALAALGELNEMEAIFARPRWTTTQCARGEVAADRLLSYARAAVFNRERATSKTPDQRAITRAATKRILELGIGELREGMGLCSKGEVFRLGGLRTKRWI